MSYKNLNTENGFSLIEIIISISILSVITALGLFISMDFARSYNFRSERSTIVSLLQKARSESLNNIDGVRHGMHFQSGPVKYILFQCPYGTPSCLAYAASANDLTLDSSWKVNIQVPVAPFDIIFDQLSGCLSSVANNCQATTISIVVNDSGTINTISVNSEGSIDW